MAVKNKHTGIKEELAFEVGMGPVPSAMHLPAVQALPALASIKS